MRGYGGQTIGGGGEVLWARRVFYDVLRCAARGVCEVRCGVHGMYITCGLTWGVSEDEKVRGEVG